HDADSARQERGHEEPPQPAAALRRRRGAPGDGGPLQRGHGVCEPRDVADLVVGRHGQDRAGFEGPGSLFRRGGRRRAKERRIEARRGGRPRGAARARGRLEDAGGLFVQIGRVGGGDRGRLEGTGDLVVIHVLRGGVGSGGRGRGEGGRLEGTGDLVVAEGVLVCRRCLGRRRRALDLRGQEGRQGDASRFLVLIEAGAEIAARYGQPRPLQRVDDLRDVVGGQPTV